MRLQVTLQSCVYDVCSENQCLFAESGEFRCGLLRRSIHYDDFVSRIEKLAWNCLPRQGSPLAFDRFALIVDVLQVD